MGQFYGLLIGEVATAEFRSIRDRFLQIEFSHFDYADHAANVFELLRAGDLLKGETAAKEVERQEDELDRFLVATLAEIELFTADSINTARRQEERSVLVLFFILLLGFTISIILSLAISRSITRPIAFAVDRIGDLALGDFDTDIQVTTKDEVGLLLSSMNDLKQKMRNLALLAEQIAAGKLDVRVEVKSKQDRLALSINSMVQALQDVAVQSGKIALGDYSAELKPRGEQDELANAINRMTAKLRQNLEQSEQLDWLKTGVARLGDKIRGDLNLDALCAQVIAEITTYLGAQVGACYLLVDEPQDGRVLVLAGTYACTKRKHLSKRFKLGEGLIGQCALDKSQILLSNVPQDYVKVGNVRPR